MAMVSDEALFERLLSGDLKAFDALYERYERPLFGFVLKYLGEQAEAEDLLHEAFLSVLRGGRVDRGEGSFRAWLFQVARNLCLNRVRTKGRAQRAMQAIGCEEDHQAVPAQLALEHHQAVQALQKAVRQLPAALGELYHLRAAGLSYEEMAEVVKAPVGTVKSRMHEMVGRLREEMKPWTAS
jgi:RNA polymerase sigma-70 factor (ECF subfamily)